jgi:hypothetical protein
MDAVIIGDAKYKRIESEGSLLHIRGTIEKLKSYYNNGMKATLFDYQTKTAHDCVNILKGDLDADKIRRREILSMGHSYGPLYGVVMDQAINDIIANSTDLRITKTVYQNLMEDYFSRKSLDKDVVDLYVIALRVALKHIDDLYHNT